MDLSDTYANNKFPVSEFKLSEMCDHPSILLIAKRGSGKSWITKAILYKLHKIPVGIIISGTEREDPFFSDFFPSSFIFFEYDSAVIKKLLVRQRIMCKKRKLKEADGKSVDSRAVIVMDDCLADNNKWANDPHLADLLYNGRHKDVTYILTMQHPMGIKPKLRSNFDYVFLLAEDIVSNQKKLYDHYAGMFPDIHSFREVFCQLTSNHGAMVIKNRGVRESLYDKIAFYKAPNLEKTKIEFGCRQFKKYHKKNFDPDWEEKLDQMDFDEFLIDNKRKKFGIRKVYQKK